MLLYSLDSLKGFFLEKCGKDYSKVKCKKYIPNVKHCVSFLTLSKMSQEFEKIKTEKETNLSKLNDLQSLQKFLMEHLTVKLNDVIKDGTCLDFIATGLFYILIFDIFEGRVLTSKNHRDHKILFNSLTHIGKFLGSF